jgi:hypothetical protein
MHPRDKFAVNSKKNAEKFGRKKEIAYFCRRKDK